MKILSGLICNAAALVAVLSAFVFSADVAAIYPERTVRMVVGFSAGGGADILSRLAAKGLTERWKQNFVVENRAGADGSIAATAVARAEADGYTLLVTTSALTITPAFQQQLFNPVTSFEPVVVMGSSPSLLLVHPTLPVYSVQELVALAKSKPGQLTYGSSGTGTIPFLAMELFKDYFGIDMVHVPYKGSADMTPALLGGHILAQSDATGFGTHVDAGRMRLLVTFGNVRTKRWPNVPTAKELGLGIVSNSPYGIAGPRGMDPRTVALLHNAFKRALEDPEHLKVLDKYDQEMSYMKSADYLKWAQDTYREERALIERLGLLAK